MLSQQDQAFAIEWLKTRAECPATITDPLEAFEWGIREAVRHLGASVSKDVTPDELARREMASRN